LIALCPSDFPLLCVSAPESWYKNDFVGAKFYCPHALVDGDQRIQTRQKMLEFSQWLK